MIKEYKKDVIAHRIEGCFCALYSEKYNVLLSDAITYFFNNPQIEQSIYDWCQTLTEDNEEQQLSFATELLEEVSND